jgi:YD repeat-containing protein
MNGDHLSNGGTRSVSVTDSQGTSLPDNYQDAGFLREKIIDNGVGGPVVSDEIRTPFQSGPAATSGTHQAWFVGIGKDVTITPLSGGRTRTTEADTSYDAQGDPTQVNDLGDTSTPADDRCTTTTYARNTGTWLLDLPSEVQTVAVACGTTPSYPDQAISDVRTYYDGGSFGAAPAAGDATQADRATSYPGGQPGFTTQSKTRFDQYGRALSVSDAMGRTTTTSYSPAAGLPLSSTVTDPAGFATTTTLDPDWNQPTSVVDANGRETDLGYDPLGRLTDVWKPGQSQAGGDPATIHYGYGTPGNAPDFIAASTIEPNGNYRTSYTIYDGFLRPRQTQSPASDGSGHRVLTDTIYDSRGLVAQADAPHVDPAAPGTSLSVVGDEQVPGETRTRYDGANRPVSTTFYSDNVAQWSTTTSYGGDHTDVTPPAGGTPTSTYFDARGNTTQVRRFTGPAPSGPYQDTTYTYTPAGQLATITDNAGNTWSYSYDLSGNRTTVNDPDTGTSKE